MPKREGFFLGGLPLSFNHLFCNYVAKAKAWFTSVNNILGPVKSSSYSNLEVRKWNTCTDSISFAKSTSLNPTPFHRSDLHDCQNRIQGQCEAFLHNLSFIFNLYVSHNFYYNSCCCFAWNEMKKISHKSRLGSSCGKVGQWIYPNGFPAQGTNPRCLCGQS